MNLAHVHIVINHIPSLGMVVAACLLIFSLQKKNDGLKKISFQLLVAMSLMALPTFMTGSAAEAMIRNQSDATKGLIQAHENAAIWTLALISITGTFAWFGLWQYRRFSRPGIGNTAIVVILSLLTAAAILRTANMGGDITHTEIRAAGAESSPQTPDFRRVWRTLPMTTPGSGRQWKQFTLSEWRCCLAWPCWFTCECWA